MSSNAQRLKRAVEQRNSTCNLGASNYSMDGLTRPKLKSAHSTLTFDGRRNSVCSSVSSVSARSDLSVGLFTSDGSSLSDTVPSLHLFGASSSATTSSGGSAAPTITPSIRPRASRRTSTFTQAPSLNSCGSSDSQTSPSTPSYSSRRQPRYRVSSANRDAPVMVLPAKAVYSPKARTHQDYLSICDEARDGEEELDDEEDFVYDAVLEYAEMDDGEPWPRRIPMSDIAHGPHVDQTKSNDSNVFLPLSVQALNMDLDNAIHDALVSSAQKDSTASSAASMRCPSRLDLSSSASLDHFSQSYRPSTRYGGASLEPAASIVSTNPEREDKSSSKGRHAGVSRKLSMSFGSRVKNLARAAMTI